MSKILKIILFIISGLVLALFLFKYEYVTLLGLISENAGKLDFFTTLYFAVMMTLMMIIILPMTSTAATLLAFSKKSGFILNLICSLTLVFIPYFQFKHSISLNSVFCPSYTIHGVISMVSKDAPKDFIGLAKSAKERCVLKNYLDRRADNSLVQNQVEITGLLKNKRRVHRENNPIFSMMILSIHYPYFNKTDIPLNTKIISYTNAIEGINSVFKKQVELDTDQMTLFGKVLFQVNDYIFKIFQKALFKIMDREYQEVRGAYLSSANRSDLRVNFDFMKIRFDLLKENLSL